MVTHETSWREARSIPRRIAKGVLLSEVPTTPGIYVWFRESEPVYLGRARGQNGLRGRLRAHLAIGIDLSRSTLRASVASRQLGIDRGQARRRPSVMTPAQVAIVNTWLAECEVGWIECISGEEADRLERSLLAEWRPALNLY